MNASIIVFLVVLTIGLLLLQQFYCRVFPRIIAKREAEARRETELRNQIRAERASAELRAWQMLEPILSIDQLLQKEKYGYILEKGSLGYYLIPMRRIFVLFQPHAFHKDNLDMQQINAGKNTDRLRQMLKYSRRCSICLSDTGQEAPWYDAVATILYTIRDGNETVIFEKGDIRSFGFLANDVSSLLTILNVIGQNHRTTRRRCERRVHDEHLN